MSVIFRELCAHHPDMQCDWQTVSQSKAVSLSMSVVTSALRRTIPCGSVNVL